MIVKASQRPIVDGYGTRTGIDVAIALEFVEAMSAATDNGNKPPKRSL